jgi:hypothetical protein
MTRETKLKEADLDLKVKDAMNTEKSLTAETDTTVVDTRDIIERDQIVEIGEETDIIIQGEKEVLLNIEMRMEELLRLRVREKCLKREER